MSPISSFPRGSRPSHPSGARAAISAGWARAPFAFVVPSQIELNSPGPIATGDALQLRAVARTAAGDALDGHLLSWSSSNPSVATITESGFLVARKPGVTRLTVQSDGVQRQTELCVTESTTLRAS